MKLFAVFFLIASLFGCSTQEKVSDSKPISKVHYIKPKAIKNKSKTLKLKPKIIKGKFNIGKEVEKILSKDLKKEFWFEKIDNKNGYARMTGYMEGHNDYYLFVGEQFNLLVEVFWSCGPACHQVVKFHKQMVSGKYNLITVESLLGPSDLKALEKHLRVCSGPKSFNSVSNQKCSMILDFPKVGTTVKAYEAQFYEDDHFRDRYGEIGK